MRATTWIHLVGAAATAAAVVTWAATGAEGYTRWPDERLAHSDAPPVAEEIGLLEDAGFSETKGEEPAPDIQSRFALGLVPGGANPRHLVSVASVIAGSLVASIAAVAARSIARRSAGSPTKGEHQ